ncbi:hypothetical protein BJ742DRAFT_793671 [Cladochytrium replicatum]|nr:hypothetical protein BJ742DRAFT_793671 [Cladochytrium replicatum]
MWADAGEIDVNVVRKRLQTSNTGVVKVSQFRLLVRQNEDLTWIRQFMPEFLLAASRSPTPSVHEETESDVTFQLQNPTDTAAPSTLRRPPSIGAAAMARNSATIIPTVLPSRSVPPLPPTPLTDADSGVSLSSTASVILNSGPVDPVVDPSATSAGPNNIYSYPIVKPATVKSPQTMLSKHQFDHPQDPNPNPGNSFIPFEDAARARASLQRNRLALERLRSENSETYQFWVRSFGVDVLEVSAHDFENACRSEVNLRLGSMAALDSKSLSSALHASGNAYSVSVSDLLPHMRGHAMAWMGPHLNDRLPPLAKLKGKYQGSGDLRFTAGNHGLTHEEMSIIINSIGPNRAFFGLASLRVLQLTSIPSSLVAGLAKCLETNLTLKEFRLGVYASVGHADHKWFTGNVPTLVGAVCDLLERNETLTTLALWNIPLHDADAKRIGSALATRRSVTNLDLDHNSITDAGAKSLAEMMPRVSTRLSLRHNKLGENVVEAFKYPLTVGCPLVHLDLWGNLPITIDGAWNLVDYAFGNEHVQYLCLPRVQSSTYNLVKSEIGFDMKIKKLKRKRNVDVHYRMAGSISFPPPKKDL